MSIEIPKMTAIVAGSHRNKGSQPAQVKGVKNFDDELAKTLNSLKTHTESSIDPLEEVELARLKMLQGLFSLESDDEKDGFFSGLEHMVEVQRLSVQQSQIVDKYARQQTYTLRDDTAGSGGEIDRLIDRVAAKVSLAPDLIHSVVSAESNYNPTAVSPVGAQGLMQLMPGTAAELGVENSFDPAQNLLGGSRYLKQLLDKYDGDLDHALAAYNWGQGNVDRHGVENLPEETRNYVDRVKKMLVAKRS